MLKKLQAIDTTTKVMFVQMNVADFSSIERAVKQIVGVVGNIDLLINGVGVVGDKDVETTINVNLVSVVVRDLCSIKILLNSEINLWTRPFTLYFKSIYFVKGIILLTNIAL